MANLRFGSNGWRGVMADDFTYDNVKIVAQAMATYLLQKDDKGEGVVVGYDQRFQSDSFAKLVARVMVANGIKCYWLGKAAPTPVVAYSVLTKNAKGAVMVTAGDEKPEMNGIKLIDEHGGAVAAEITEELENILRAMDKVGGIRIIDEKQLFKEELFHEIDPLPVYQEHLKRLVDMEAIKKGNLNILIDPLYGAGTGYLKSIFGDKEILIKEIHDWRDPLFAQGRPICDEERLKTLREQVVAGGYDLGLALDGAGEAFGIVDSNGELMESNQMLALIYYHFLEVRKILGSVARSTITTHVLDRMALKAGYGVHETVSGFRNISQKMHFQDVAIGAEESGGLAVGDHIAGRDGLLACLLIAEIRAIHGKTLMGIVKQIEAEYGAFVSKKHVISLLAENREEIITAFEELALENVLKVQETEIIHRNEKKIILEDGAWFVLRLRKDANKLEVYLEGSSKLQLMEIESEIDKYFNTIKPEI